MALTGIGGSIPSWPTSPTNYNPQATVTMIKLQPGYHCYGCPCYDSDYRFCNVKNDYVKCDYNDAKLPAMPLFECPVDHITLSALIDGTMAADLRRTQIMGIFDEDEYDQWLGQGGNDAG